MRYESPASRQGIGPSLLENFSLGQRITAWGGPLKSASYFASMGMRIGIGTSPPFPQEMT